MKRLSHLTGYFGQCYLRCHHIVHTWNSFSDSFLWLSHLSSTHFVPYLSNGCIMQLEWPFHHWLMANAWKKFLSFWHDKSFYSGSVSLHSKNSKSSIILFINTEHLCNVLSKQRWFFSPFFSLLDNVFLIFFLFWISTALLQEACNFILFVICDLKMSFA